MNYYVTKIDIGPRFTDTIRHPYNIIKNRYKPTFITHSIIFFPVSSAKHLEYLEYIVNTRIIEVSKTDIRKEFTNLVMREPLLNT